MNSSTPAAAPTPYGPYNSAGSGATLSGGHRIRSIVLRAVIRLLAVIAVAAAAQAVAWLNLLGDDSGLGVGLLSFAATALLCGVWSLVDGTRHGLAGVVISWAIVAVLGGLASTAATVVAGMLAGSGSLGDFVLMVDTIPFLVGLIAFPASLGALIGHLVRRGSGTPQ